MRYSSQRRSRMSGLTHDDIMEIDRQGQRMELERADADLIIGQEIIRLGFGKLPQRLVNHRGHDHDRNNQEADNDRGNLPSAALFRHGIPFPGARISSLVLLQSKNLSHAPTVAERNLTF